MTLKMPYGDNMIEVSVKFWTDKLPKEKDDGKTAWMKGGIYLPKNKSRGIDDNGLLFNNENEFLPKLKELLDKNGIKLLDIDEPHDPIDLTKICP